MQMNSLLVTSGWCLKLLTLSKWKYKYNYQNYQYNHNYKYKWCTRRTRMRYYLCWRWSGNQQLIMQRLVIIDFLYFAWQAQEKIEKIAKAKNLQNFNFLIYLFAPSETSLWFQPEIQDPKGSFPTFAFLHFKPFLFYLSVTISQVFTSMYNIATLTRKKVFSPPLTFFCTLRWLKENRHTVIICLLIGNHFTFLL